MESLLVKEIRKKKVVVGGVRLDVVDEDELMACSKGNRFRWSESRDLWESGDLYSESDG